MATNENAASTLKNDLNQLKEDVQNRAGQPNSPVQQQYWENVANYGGGQPSTPSVTSGTSSDYMQQYWQHLADGDLTPQVTGGGGGSGGGSGVSASVTKKYTPAKLPIASSQADYINAMYNNKQNANLANLQSAYDQNVIDLNRTASEIPGKYNAAANQAAVQDAISQRNFAEYANATGYNSGAGSHARLAQMNRASANQNSLRAEQAKALSDVEYQRQKMAAEYRNAIAKAIADNDTARATALYQEAVRVDESIVNTAVNQANENYKAWAAMYK